MDFVRFRLSTGMRQRRWLTQPRREWNRWGRRLKRPSDGIRLMGSHLSGVPHRGLKTPPISGLSLIWVICVSYSLIVFFTSRFVVQDLFQQYRGVGILPLFHRNHDVMAFDWNPYEAWSIFVVGFKMKQSTHGISHQLRSLDLVNKGKKNPMPLDFYIFWSPVRWFQLQRLWRQLALAPFRRPDFKVSITGGRGQDDLKFDLWFD